MLQVCDAHLSDDFVLENTDHSIDIMQTLREVSDDSYSQVVVINRTKINTIWLHRWPQRSTKPCFSANSTTCSKTVGICTLKL